MSKQKHWDMVYQDMDMQQFEAFSTDISEKLPKDEHYFTKEKKVLDAGCGTGRVTYDLINRGATSEFTCTDIAITKAKQFLSRHPQVTVIKADLHDLPFNNEEFNYTICRGVLHHCEAPYAVLRELCRVTKDEIYLVTTRKRGISYIKVYAKRYILKLVPHTIAKWATKNKPFLRHYIFDTSKAPIRHALNENKVKDILTEEGFYPETTCPSSRIEYGKGQSLIIRAYKMHKNK